MEPDEKDDTQAIDEKIGAGMSRAAKKRAKKKFKISNQLPENDDGKSDGDEKKSDKGNEMHSRIAEKPPLKRRKHPQTLASETDENAASKITRDGNDVGELEHESQDIFKVDSSGVLTNGALSTLRPAEILQSFSFNQSEKNKKIYPELVNNSKLLEDSTVKERAKCLFQSILGRNITVSEFYQSYWEKKPLLVQDHGIANRWDGFISKSRIHSLIETAPLAYARDLTITQYEHINGSRRRITLNPIPKNEDDVLLLDAKDVWSNYDNGATIRLLCPQEHVEEIWSLLSTLEIEWGCMVGSNVYLTPPGSSQGFSPHYDDICAYILQVEGKKRWKVYAPLSKRETLPRVSSRDYTEDELKDVQPLLDVVLSPGDLLYLPRGWIHQACTLDDNQFHSLHVTVSAMQNWAWIDFLELLIPQALEAAAQSEISTTLRQGLPRNFLEYMGAIYDQPEDPEELKPLSQRDGSFSGEQGSHNQRELDSLRKTFMEETKKRIIRVSKEALSLIDAACDQMGKRFLSDRLPPALSAKEASYTNDNRDANGGKILPNTMIRLVRPGIARLVLEDDKAVLYHCMDNSRVYHGNPLSPLEFEMDDAPAIETILKTIEPHWIIVEDLIHDDIEDKVDIAQSLYNEGILAIFQSAR
jgi:bifunctional lysine-specific demethylase and histidyl-hydroxylase NO66